MNFTSRKFLLHDVPSWVDPQESDYFVTICCKQRVTNQLCIPTVGTALLESARFYKEKQKWCPTVFLLMPDHLHMLVSFGWDHRLEDVIGAWKRYAATEHKIVWQKGFFEHRLRQQESAEEKARYILQNPVRAGLVQAIEAWPYYWVMRD